MPESPAPAATSGEHGTPTLIEHDAAPSGEAVPLHRPTPAQQKSDTLVRIKRSHLVALSTILGFLPGGGAYLASHLGGAQSEAETQQVVNIAFEEAVQKMEARVDMRATELERKVGEAKQETDHKLENIEEDIAEMKLDMRDLKRDMAEIKADR